MTGGPLFRRWLSIYKPRAENYYEKMREAKIKAALDSSYTDPLLISDSTPLLGDERGILRTKTVDGKSVVEGYGSTDAFRATEAQTRKNLYIPNAPKPPSIVGVIFSMFKWSFLGATLVKISSDLLQFANPMLLK